MTIPSTYKLSTTDNTDTTPTEKIGGVAIGITSATTVTTGSPLTKVFDLKTQGTDGVTRRTAPKDTASTIEAKGAGTGTFAYDQSAWIFIGNQANNKINNSTSTALTLNGHESVRDGERSIIGPIGAKTSTGWRARTFNPLGISAQRTNWSSAPGTMTGASDKFYDPANGTVMVLGTDADEAIGTRSVPGELTYMYGALDAKQDNYKEKTGG